MNEQDKAEVWCDGVDDYLKYARQLMKEYDDILAKGDQMETRPSSIFGQDIGKSAPSVTFNFAAAASPAPFVFTGFAANPATNGAQPADDEDEEAEEEADTGPSIALESASADILMSKRVGLMSLNPETKKWKDRGTGTLTLRRSKDGAGNPYLVFTTDSGRVLLNAPLVKGLKPIVNPKAPKNLIMMLISRVSADQPEERGTQLFKCDSVESLKELLAKVTELV